MANKIGLITKWSTEMFDEAYVAGARSSVLDANKGLLSFTGAKTVRFPKWQGDGLYNYNRANTMINGEYVGQSTYNGAGKGYGYQQGDTNLVWEEKTMRVDRAIQYRIDRADNEETQEKAVAFATGQINKQKIIPEIDAYCFSQIVHEACSTDLGNLVTDTKTNGVIQNPLAVLDAGTKFLHENEVEDGNIVGFVSTEFEYAMRRSSEVTKYARPEDFVKSWDFLIDNYNGVQYVEVPPRRFMTDIELGAGYFGASSTSKRIDVLLVDKSAVFHVVKYNTIKVFGPEVVQDYDGYKINARIYHDVFIPDNKKVGCYAVIAADTDTVTNAENKLAISISGTGTAAMINGVTTVPGSLIYDSIVMSDTALKVGDASSGTEVEVYTALGKASKSVVYFGIVKDGKIIAVSAAKTIA